MWCGFTSNFILGPYFYQEPDERGDFETVTVNGERYLEMLEAFVIPELGASGALATTTFMQDGAPPHVARPVKGRLYHVMVSFYAVRGFFLLCFRFASTRIWRQDNQS